MTQDRPLTGIKEVAALAGVSIATVSNVLNRPEKVSEATRRRVEIVIGHLGFVPNQGAAALRSGRSRMIGLVVPDIANPFFAEVARGAIDAADRLGHVVTLCNSDADAAREARCLEVLEEQRVAGVLLTPVGAPPATLRRLAAAGSRTVILDVAAKAEEHCSVSVDDVEGGMLAARHLLDGGARRLVFVSGPKSLRQCADRRKGVRTAVKQTPGTTLVELYAPAMTIAEGRAIAGQLLELDRRPDAVFCANDLLAMGVQRGLAAAGVKQPKEIALVGYDDIDLAADLPVPLTSVRQPTYLLGEKAAELLLAEINGEDADHRHTRLVYRPELVVRESSQR